MINVGIRIKRERFKEEIDSILAEVERGIEEIERTLAEAERRHMEEECHKFIDALEAGNIQPIDF